jgi:hypothetical protein
MKLFDRTGCSPVTTSPVDPARRRLCTALPGLGLAVSGGGLLLGGCATAPSQADATGAAHGVMPFSGAAGQGDIPPGWKPYIMRRDRNRTAYATALRDDRTVLHAHADGSSSGLHCPVDVDPLATPWLSWQWRVDALHERATVEDDDAEDTPARIVVAFDGDLARLSLRERLFYEQVEFFTGNRLPYATLTYVWDGRLAVGQVVPYTRSKRIQFQVVESGTARLGRWLAYERNVVDDFRAVFGETPPGRITSVGVLTDSDDLKNQVEAWYGDIGLHAQSQA